MFRPLLVGPSFFTIAITDEFMSAIQPATHIFF